jgi:hypothetical protein
VAANAAALLCLEGGYFIQSLSLASLVRNLQAVFPEEWEQQRLRLRRSVFPGSSLYEPPLNAKLETILYHILPHFLKSSRDPRRPRAGANPVLARLAPKIPVASGQPPPAGALRERQTSLEQVLRQLQNLQKPPDPPREQRLSGRELAGWFQENLQAHLAHQEFQHWHREFVQVQNLLKLPGPELAALLSIAARGEVEVDGCGCFPDTRYPGHYVVYKRTGEFVLQDYFGRLYLFPDCRVGVSTAGPFHPQVLDEYKHPLLRRFQPRQPICLTGYQPAQEFSAAAVITALEEGLNALFYGYNSRKRNGYNSLDSFGRHLSVVDFENWRLPPDDPRVTDGRLEVKNKFF